MVMDRELITLEVTQRPNNPCQLQVVFVPPPDEVLAEYVHAVCRDLGDGCDCSELESGMFAYLRVCMRALARELTAKHNGEIDSRIE